MSGTGQPRSSATHPGVSPRLLSSLSHRSAAAYRTDSGYNFYNHPARISILDGNSDSIIDSLSFFLSSPGRGHLTMDETGRDETASMWRVSTGIMPSFSRAFELFANSEIQGDDDSESSHDSFFVPTYLKYSAHMDRLQEAYKIRMQSNSELKRNMMPSSKNGSSQSLPPVSRKNLPYTIKKQVSSPNIDPLAPLPTRWNKTDMNGCFEFHTEQLGVKFVETKGHHDREHEACGIRADNYIPVQCGIYYFEVQILSGRRDETLISIGFSTKSASTTRPVGWEPDSWGYHADDGRCFSGQNTGRTYGPTYAAGDVIGCGINFRDRTGFYTKNGVNIGNAFHSLPRGKLYPTVSLKRNGEHVLANFGQTPFVYNIDDMMREQQEKIRKDIEEADTSKLEPGLAEPNFIQSLVMQFLQHDGYIETARAFAGEVKMQDEALSSNTGVQLDSISLQDDEDANNRQRIRRAILEGDVDRALKYINAYYPQVLQEHETIYFKLRCRKFIEMVRKAAQLNIAAEIQDGHGTMDMDIDANGDDYDWTDAPMKQADGGVLDLEKQMLEYGQALQAEYAEDSRPEVGKALDEIWSLIAYRNPLQESQVSHLLDRKGRVAVAEELNSAILCKYHEDKCHYLLAVGRKANSKQYRWVDHHDQRWKSSTRRRLFSSNF